MEEGLAQSVETALNRVNSAVFDEKELSQDEKIKKQSTLWPAKGLNLDRNGQVIRSKTHILKELLRGLFRGTALGFLFKGGLNLVFALIKRKKLGELSAEVLNQDVFSFTKFLGTYLGIFRFVNAYMASSTGKESADNSLVAGAVASIALLLDTQERRKSIALFMFVRAMDVTVKRLVRLGKIPYISLFESLIFGITNVPIVYGFLYEPEILDKGYYKWILNMGNVPEIGVIKTFREPMYARERGEILPFQPCCPHYHEGPCPNYIFKDFFWGLGRAGKIYLPVHLLPLLIFRYKSLVNDTVKTLAHTVKAFISSCVFLSSYVVFIKSTVCFNRNRLKRDERWFGVVAGLLTSFSTYFERPSRVSELMLYCVPRSMLGAWMFLERRGKVKPIPLYELPMFAFAMSVLMSCRRSDFKPTYHDGLGWLLGA